MVLNYYCAALEYIQSIIAAEGIQILGKDHHKEAISSIVSIHYYETGIVCKRR